MAEWKGWLLCSLTVDLPLSTVTSPLHDSKSHAIQRMKKKTAQVVLYIFELDGEKGDYPGLSAGSCMRHLHMRRGHGKCTYVPPPRRLQLPCGRYIRHLPTTSAGTFWSYKAAPNCRENHPPQLDPC